MAPIRTFSRNKPKFIARSEWKIFFWCVLVATFLWFLTALNESYTNTIDVKVHYQNVPNNKIFVRPLPDNFKVAVTAKGWDLLAFSVGGRSESFNIDLNDFQNEPYILSRRLKVNVQQQISQKININDIYPDTISLAVARKLVKTVPIKLNVKLTFENQHQLGGDITFSPDSIVVSGPVSYVKQVQSVETEPVVLKNLKEEATMSVKLHKPEHTNIRYSTGSIKIKIPVYQLTEGSVEVPVSIINPEIQGIKLIPEKIKITYQTTLNQYQGIDASMFEAMVDGGRIDTTSQQPLKVQLLNQPRFIYNLRLDPEYVNYVINK